MRFGTRKADVVETGNNGNFIKYFRDGETRLVFLDELEDWTKYFEHYSQSQRLSYPCTGEKDTCPGCTSENQKERNASGKYLTNVINPDTGYVDLYKIPASLIPTFERYFDKAGTIKGRVYEIYRGKGSNDRINYTASREEPFKVEDDVSEKMQSHEDALLRSYVEVWDEEPDDADSPVGSAKKPRQKNYAAQIAERGEDDKPPFDEEEQEITEDQLNKMDSKELLSLFNQAGIEAPDTEDADELREALIDALGE